MQSSTLNKSGAFTTMQPAGAGGIHQLVLESLDKRLTRMRPGERLPSIRKLMGQHNVNQLTVERCLAFMEGQGRIVRKPRSGIFAADPVSSPTARSQTVKAIGVIVPSLTGYLDVGTFLEEVELGAADKGWMVQVCNALQGLEHEMDFFRRCLANGTDAIIVYTSSNNPMVDEYCDQIRSFVSKGNAKLVSVDLAVPGLPCDLVRHNGFEAYREATSAILERGCRQICYFELASGLMSAQRLAGVHKAMESVPEPIRFKRICADVDPKTWEISSCEEAVKILLEQMPADTDALIVGSTSLLEGSMRAVEQLGRKINKDLMMVACVNAEEVLSNQPTITLRKSMRLAGKKAFELLSDRIANPDRPPVDCRLPFEIVTSNEVSS